MLSVKDEIVELLRKGPRSLDDLSRHFDMLDLDLIDALCVLRVCGQIFTQVQNGKLFVYLQEKLPL